MKWFWCFVVAGAIVSCNIKNEEAVEVPVAVISGTPLNPDTINSAETDTLPDNSNLRTIKKTKLLLVARGSEPGWYAEFFADHLRLLIDNGTDSLLSEYDFSKINENKTYAVTFGMGSNSDNPKENYEINISLKDKPCTEEASGEKRERSISIKYKNKTYKGCATANIK